MNRNKKDSPSKNSQGTGRVVPETLTKVATETVFSNKTATLNPITTSPSFNPVQNLFNKLKQQLDDSYNRPSGTEVNKERLFSDLDLETQKSSRKQKKSNKKSKSGIFDRISMPLLPSSSSSFSDNGYFSSSSLSKKPTEDVILFNDENEEDDCEVLLNTGPMPSFVLETGNKHDNDIILIPDDYSDTSSPSREMIVVDDVRNTRSSPRISKGDLSGSNISQQKNRDNLSAYGIINLEEAEQSDKDKSAQISSKDSGEKPRRRRTLMPTTAMPSIFFNTPRLLRSELGQKKGVPVETKTSSTKTLSKVQKSDNKLEKSSVKPRKEKSDLKGKSNTENLIYEVVKSTENNKNSSEICTKSQDAILVVDASPPKVEPLIIKLKKSAEQSTHISEQNGNEDVRSKEKSQKADVNKVTKNLFFPRLLRSDINQQKESKTESNKKSAKSSDNAVATSDLDTAQKNPQLQNENSISLGKVAVKSTKEISEKVQETLLDTQKSVPKTPTQKLRLLNVEKKTTEKTASPSAKKAEKSPLTARRTLRSDISQEQNNLLTANNDDGQNISETQPLTPRRTLRSDISQEQNNSNAINDTQVNTIIEIIDNSRTDGTKNVANDNQVQRHLRSESAQKKIDSEIINVDEVTLNQEKSKESDKIVECMDIIDVDNANTTEEKTKKVTSKSKNNVSDIIDVDEISTFEEPAKKHSSRAKNVAVVQPMSRRPRSESPQKKSDSENVTTDQTSQCHEKSKKNMPKTKHSIVNQSSPQQLKLPQNEPIDVDVISVLRFYSSEDKSKKDIISKDTTSSTERRHLRSDDTQKTPENKEAVKNNPVDSKKLPKAKENIVESTGNKQLRSEAQKKASDPEIEAGSPSTKDISKVKKINEKSVDSEQEKNISSNIETNKTRTLRSNLAQDLDGTNNTSNQDVQKAVDKDTSKIVEETKTKSLKTNTTQKEEFKMTEHDVSEKETSTTKTDAEEAKTRTLRSTITQTEENSKKESPKVKEIPEEQSMLRTLRSDVAQKEVDTSKNALNKTDKNVNNEKAENNQQKENTGKMNSTEAVTNNSKPANTSAEKSPKSTIKMKKDLTKKTGNIVKKSAKSMLKSLKEKSTIEEVTQNVNLVEVHSPKDLNKNKTTTNEENPQPTKDKNISKKSKNILLKAKNIVTKNRLLKAKITAAKKTANKKLKSNISQKKTSSKVKEKSEKITVNAEKQNEKDKLKPTDIQTKPKKKLEKKTDIQTANQVILTVSSMKNQSKTDVLEGPPQKKSPVNTEKTKVSKPEESQKSECNKKTTNSKAISETNIITHSRRSKSLSKLDIPTQNSEVEQKKEVVPEITKQESVKTSPKPSLSKTETKRKTDGTQKPADSDNKIIALETANPKSKTDVLKQKIDDLPKESTTLNTTKGNNKTKSEVSATKSDVLKKKSETSPQKTKTIQKKSEKESENSNSTRSNSNTRPSKTDPAIINQSVETLDNSRSNSKTRGTKPEIAAKKSEVTQKKSTDPETIDKPVISHRISAEAEIINQLDSVLITNRGNSKTRTSEKYAQKTDTIQKKSTDSKPKDTIESKRKYKTKKQKKLQDNKTNLENVEVSTKELKQKKSNKIEEAKKVVKSIKKARITKVSPLEPSYQIKPEDLSPDTSSTKSEIAIPKFDISHKRGADLEIIKQSVSLILHSRRSTSKPNKEDGTKHTENPPAKTTATNSSNMDNGNEKDQQKSVKQKKGMKTVETAKIKKPVKDIVEQPSRTKGIKRELANEEVIDLTKSNQGTKIHQKEKTKPVPEVIQITDDDATKSKNQHKIVHKSRKSEIKDSQQKEKAKSTVEVIEIVDDDPAKIKNQQKTFKPKKSENKAHQPKEKKKPILEVIEVADEDPAKSKSQQKMGSKTNKSDNKNSKILGKEISSLKKTPQKKQEDLDLIQVVTEKRIKKQGNNVSPKLLRSSINPVVVKEEKVTSKASPVVEKVVALIHSEPKPKDHYETIEQKTETNPQTTEKSKARSLRSQNITDIETIDIVSEEKAPAKKKDKTKEKKKKVAEKQGISQKSKIITKKNTIAVAKKLKSNTKIKTGTKSKPTKVKNAKSINKKVITKSKLPTLSNKYKQKIIKEVKLKLKNSKKGNLLKSPSKSKTKSSGKRKNVLDWQNNVIIERIIQEIKNTIFKQEPIEDAKQSNSKAVSLLTKKAKDNKQKEVTRIKAAKAAAAKLKKKTLRKSDKRKIIQAAKKKMLQTKEALKRKLRSAISVESNSINQGNTSNSSDSKENNPPQNSEVNSKENNQDPIEKYSKLSKPEELNDIPAEAPPIPVSNQKSSNSSIIIINEVSVSANLNMPGNTLKRKNTEPAESVTTKRKNYRSTILSRHISSITSGTLTDNSKKKDTTVFDFDESEPEVTPLRHKSGPKVNANEAPTATPDKTVSTTPLEADIPQSSKIETVTSQKRPVYPTTSSSSSLPSTNTENELRKQINKQVPVTSSTTKRPDLPIASSTPAVVQEKRLDKAYPGTLRKPTILDRQVPGTSGISSLYKQRVYSKIPQRDENGYYYNNPTSVNEERLYSEFLTYSDEEDEEDEEEEDDDSYFKRLPLKNALPGKTVKVINIDKEPGTSSIIETGDVPCQELVSTRRKLLVPFLEEDGQAKKLWTVIDTSHRRHVTPPRQIEQHSDIFGPSTSAEVPPSDTGTSNEKKSPLKQPTIIEMFSKVWMKKEHPMKPLSEESGDDTEKEVFTKPLPVALPAPSPRVERCEDEDSDNESRLEWIPEEYAEYKFKYSASKMMQTKGVFKCKICMMTLPSYYKLLKHRKEHEKKEKPYHCTQCRFDFANVDEFSAHLRIHKGKHPYLCPKCDSGFWTKSAYEAHIPVHILKKPKQPIKKFRCDICAKEFSKLCDVERHTRVHTGEKPCICNICNKRFQQAHNLSKHLLTHLHIKPFHCEICNKQFGRNDVLRRHLLTHSVDKPIKCSVCHRGFIRASQLLQHMRRKHPDVAIDLSDLNVEEGDARDERLYATDYNVRRPGGSKQSMKQEA